MSRIVGVDVGGTFTDLFLFDEATRTFRTAKVPSRRGDEAAGFLDGLRALGGVAGRLDRARHHRRHQRAAGAARAEDRRHHHARLSRRAGDAPARPAPHLGPVGRLHADRRSRHAARSVASARSPTARSGRTVDADEVRAAAQRLVAQGAQARRHHLHQRLRQCRERSSARSPRCARSGRTTTSTASHEVLLRDPRVRALLDRRRSTPTCSRSSPPTSPSWKTRWRRRAPPRSTSCSRTAASCRPRPRASCRCAPRCRARRPA